MRFSVPADDGQELEFECPDTLASRWVSEEILRGRTYPDVPFVGEVTTILDVGANCGAATVYFAHHHPDAVIHSFEPGSEARSYLDRNVAELPNVRVHPIGLHAVDQTTQLFKGDGDLGMASVVKRWVNLDESEPVELRAAGPWVAEHGIETIDILKVDVEGCEVFVLESLRALLPQVKVLYVEYDSRDARRTIDGLLSDTHELYAAIAFLDQGECMYLRKDLADVEVAAEHLRGLLRTRMAQ